MKASHHDRCILCNAASLQPLEAYQKDHLVKCNACSFVFCSRIPSSEELTAHYQNYHRGGGISPITIKRYHALLDDFEKHKHTGNILDIGCGDAHFLEVAKQRGWSCYGTEYTDEAIAVCRSKGIVIHQGSLNAANYPGIEFDVITSFEVIEHINNPQEEAAHISRILRKGGLLYITTPNFNSISRYLLGPKWSVIEYPEHLSYYTPKTLRRLFESRNFSCLKSETTGISIRRLKEGMDPSKAAEASGKEEELRAKAEGRNIYALLKWTANSLLDWTALGDNLKMTFRKE